MTIKIDAKIVGYEVVKPEEEAAVKAAAQQEKEEKCQPSFCDAHDLILKDDVDPNVGENREEAGD